MTIKDEIKRDHELLTEWRRDFHAHPELAFEEERTSALVAERLESFGIEVDRGLARTGVVGTLESGDRQPGDRPARRYGCAAHAGRQRFRPRFDGPGENAWLRP